ncbi:MAG: Type 1 glutamine amidotransferase-like domain-containing protein [Clostridia bacterium]|nr:Type 1 glutamine amidotransferase-like domain-containing protein [Clostridia bacterium]
MKTLYLTSSHVGEYRGNAPLSYRGLNPANGLVEELKKDWREGNCLVFASDPDAHRLTDEVASELKELLLASALPVGKMDVCDGRREELSDCLAEYDFLFLCGGHVPTQIKFFHKIRLKQKLERYDGIIMGVSAGSMSQARRVYAQPEEEGETEEWYERWLEGLALTECNLLPHYQAVKNDVLDGKRVFEDVTYPDSFGEKFYAVPDGSFILQREKAVLCGEGYLISDGVIKKICKNGQKIEI